MGGGLSPDTLPREQGSEAWAGMALKQQWKLLLSLQITDDCYGVVQFAFPNWNSKTEAAKVNYLAR